MALTSRKESCDSNTPSDLSRRRSPKETTQWDRASTSNSSVHTTSTAATSEDSDQFDYTEQYPGGVPYIFDRKSFHSFGKSMLHFRNQSQSTVGTFLAGSIHGSAATSSPARLSNIPSFEVEDGSPDDLLETRAHEARLLESKIARVASRNFSVEKVTALEEEVDRWLSEATAADASTALVLSSFLLKAILANHVAFSDAYNVAKDTEMSLKLQVDELELEKREIEAEKRELEAEKRKLEAEKRELEVEKRELEVELQNHKVQYNQDQECQTLPRELSRPVTTPSVPSRSRSSTSSSFGSRVASPTSPSNIASRLSRLGF